MNNEQFRKLILAGSSKPSNSHNGGRSKSDNSLGSRQRASVSMTPRSVGGSQADFARQLAERNRALQPQKKFRTSVPKGVRLGDGYVDRAQKQDDETADDREARLKALEKSLKDEEIDQETYEKLRFQIAGGDLQSTHLVKGLDFKLLERIRKGEDVYGNGNAESREDVDDEFDRLEEPEVQAVEREKEKKKGQLSTVALAPGKKRTRDQILAELKASRLAARQEPALGDRFKKIGDKKTPGSRIERDHKGREVLIIVDEDGHEKRKVRKLQPGDDERSELLMPDKNAKPLGMEVPEEYRRKEEEPEDDGNDDIFDDVGDDYDPLAGMDDESGSSDEEGETKDNGDVSKETKTERTTSPPQPAARRNYFQGSRTALMSDGGDRGPSVSDPAIMAAIKKAASLRQIRDEGEGDDGGERALAEERRKKMLSRRDRDDDDLDMGFGTSRFEDEEDVDDAKVKLSRWGEDGDGRGDGRGGGSKRKRGPKKRKADGNNAADVMRVIEQRKGS